MKTSKNVTVIVEYFPPRLGADRRIFELMRRLSKEYRVDFIVVPPAYTLYIKRIDEKCFHETRLICDNIIGHQIGLPNWVWKLWRRGFILAYVVTMPYLVLKVIRKLIECKSDVVIIKDTSVYAGLIGTLCSRILRKFSIVDFDDLKSTYTAQLTKAKVRRGFPFIQKLLIVIEDFILKSNRKVTALSSFLVNYAAQRGIRNDLVLIPDGVDTQLFDPSKFDGKEARKALGIQESTKLCVYTGRIDENMGGEILFETARLFSSEINTIRFLIIGEGDPSLVARLAKLKNTILIGRIPIEEIPGYLVAADIILVPYPNKPASHAASPLKLFEGLAMEKPVIASAVSEIGNVVSQGYNGILVSADPKEWFFSIVRLAENYDAFVNIGKNGRTIVCEKYDWNMLAKAFRRVIENKA